jgi:hypothetical protein
VIWRKVARRAVAANAKRPANRRAKHPAASQTNHVSKKPKTTADIIVGSKRNLREKSAGCRAFLGIF